MKPRAASQLRADLIAASATGSGIGLMALMITWLVGNRLFGLLLEPPRGPTVAFAVAIALGIATTALTGKRLAATTTTNTMEPDDNALKDSSTSGVT